MIKSASTMFTLLRMLLYSFRTMLIANVGDCRAMEIKLSKDHKPSCTFERLRIEKLGGVIYDGYVNYDLDFCYACIQYKSSIVI
ncbi:hypothetical protein DVH24_021511 [Malus domestica]|uniref:PPM-type phosphatase domain-containing protein n=1 Tax=Malus domestica TaxID=3750 RepID=A0A498JUZ5_MALDO|nr:hypothetical protein DVH24_021511 [Malus domestica]